MTREEFLDSLRYYLSEMPKGVLDKILEEYANIFDEGRKLGKTDEEIIRELGSPKEIALEYIEYQRVTEENTSRKNYRTKGFFRHSDTGEINWGMVILAIMSSPITLPMIFAFFGLTLGFAIIILIGGIFSIVFGLYLVMGSLFSALPFVKIPPFLEPISLLTKILIGASSVVFGIVLVNIIIIFIKALIEKINNRGKEVKDKEEKKILKSRNRFNSRMFLLFILLLFLSITSFIFLDRDKYRGKKMDIGKNVSEIYLDLIRGSKNIPYEKYGLTNPIPKVILDEVEEKVAKTESYEYDISDIKKLNIRSGSINCKIVPSDSNKILLNVTEYEKDIGDSNEFTPFEEFKDGEVLSFNSKGHTSFEITINIPTKSDLNVYLSGAKVNLENNCLLKELTIDGTDISCVSHTEKSFDIKIDSQSIDMDVLVRENNFDCILTGFKIDYEIFDKKGKRMVYLKEKFGTGEDKLLLNAFSVDLTMGEE